MGFSKLFKSKTPVVVPKAEQSKKEVTPARDEMPAKAVNPDEIKQAVIEALHTVYDPEIPVNVYEMGLVYDIDVDTAGKVVVRMTLTSPGCPVAASLPLEVEGKTRMIPGVSEARIVLVWDPPWDPSMMTDAARLQLGFL